MIDLRISAKRAWQGSEDSLQIECAGWLKKELYLRDEPQLFFHPANGGRRSVREGARFRLMGVLAGASDVITLIPAGAYHGFICELKNYKGVLAEAQKQFLSHASTKGYFCCVINDFTTFKNTFTEYIDQ